DAPVLVIIVVKLLHLALSAGADRSHRRVPAEIGEIEAQREAGLEQIVPRRYVVVRAVDVDARHPLSPRTAFELDVPLEVLPETFQAAFEWLHGAGRERAEGFAGAEEIGMHFQNLQIAHLSVSGI